MVLQCSLHFFLSLQDYKQLLTTAEKIGSRGGSLALNIGTLKILMEDHYVITVAKVVRLAMMSLVCICGSDKCRSLNLIDAAKSQLVITETLIVCANVSINSIAIIISHVETQ